MDMLRERIKEVYTQYTWVKLVAFFVLISAAIVLELCSGGFPPWSWRFLLQILPQVPQLWHIQGAALFFPLLGLCLQAFSLLMLWSVIFILAWRIIRSLWMDLRNRQSLQEDMRAAEALTRHHQNEEEEEEEDEPQQAPSHPSRRRATAQLAQPTRQRNTTQLARPTRQEQAYSARSAVGSDVSFPGLSYPTPILRQASSTTSTRTDPTSNSGQTTRNWQMPEQEQPASRPTARITRSFTENPSTEKFVTRNNLRIVTPIPQGPLEPDDLDEDEENDDTTVSQEFARLIAKEELKQAREALYGEPESQSDGNDQEEEEEILHFDDNLDQIATRPVVRSRAGASRPVSTEDEADDQESRLIVSIGLDPGLTRKNAPNEDSVFAIQGMRVTEGGSKPTGLFAVADGMGGHANGREASRSAIHTLSDVVVPPLLHDVSSGGNASDEETFFLDLLKDGVHRANLELYRRNRDLPRMMGTTITSALIMDTTAFVVNVGDSRTYLYRAGEGLMQVTRDHSVVARLVETGAITREQVYTHPQRNQIYRCLGERASVEIDTFIVPLQDADVLILCSDGLWEMVQDPELEQIAASSAHSPSQLSTLLVQAALDHGGADNISVIVVRLASADRTSNWML